MLSNMCVCVCVKKFLGYDSNGYCSNLVFLYVRLTKSEGVHGPLVVEV